MYLASVGMYSNPQACGNILANVTDKAMGISTDYEVAKPESTSRDSIPILHFGLSYFSITLSLNVVLTFMIAARLFLHNRDIQKMAATSSLTHTTVATMLIESCALYAATSLLYIIPFRIRDNLSYTFLPLLADVQVCATSASSWCSASFGHRCLIMVSRSSHRSSSLSESPTGGLSWKTPSIPGPPVWFLGTKESQRAVVEPFLVDVRRIQWIGIMESRLGG